MSNERDVARTARKLRASRDRWKQRSAEKQTQIRQLRVANRDLSTSRDRWKARVQELERQLRAVHAAAEHPSEDTPAARGFWGGPIIPRSRTSWIPRSWLGD
jgi:predicted  nucleic acid-binding Zn-ribbon protein